ncbi:antitoxin VbhA family protein [Ruminococcus sp.]|uniref:antitoxin VbhA family protein n=1 Tax=Ruminococcus sp. TaxID=41978 RepID=UPI0025E0F5EA|nr:antitoxin VbhA family protein [Ruminococcus sp.]MBQ8965034.1 antitoxin VbhA family protein [Ruminococcus sp.]
MDKKQKRSLEQAIASVEMEGFRFTEKDKKVCEALVSGELHIEKFLEDCKAGKLKYYVGG